MRSVEEILNDLRILDGGLGNEVELPCHDSSPTWILDEIWDKVQEVGQRALSAYMDFCKEENYPHSYLLGLDILIMGEVDPKNPKHIINIHPTIVEGPCCNSYPACPNLDSYKLYMRIKNKGFNPDEVQYPVHPTKIRDKIAQLFWKLWRLQGGEGVPTVAVFTRPYPESEEESAHIVMLDGFLKNGLDAVRITPAEKPYVKDGYLWVGDKKIHFAYRRIERIHIPVFYGENLGNQIINQTYNTKWVNPLEIDDLRSKTIEEKVFRRWEAKTGKKIPRPVTLLENEITPQNVMKLCERGGFVMKRWNSTGGKGVFLHVNLERAIYVCDFLYKKYDGRHMILMDMDKLNETLKIFENFKEDTAVQQLRFIDARDIENNRKLVYDTRINALYDPELKKWEFISGISRVVPCGVDVDNGNSLLTNITSGAEIAPLVIGYTKNPEFKKTLNFGPLISQILKGSDELYLE